MNMTITKKNNAKLTPLVIVMGDTLEGAGFGETANDAVWRRRA
jgi:hypothetical protein